MSTNAVLRSPMSPVVRGWRAYFAPVDRARGVPAIFDPARDWQFDPDAPPSPWIDAGWIENFARTQNTRFAAVRSGPKGAPAAQCRTELDARVEFDFRQWGKLQMALAGASEHMNVLAETVAATGAPSGGTAAAAVAVQPGSSPSEIVIGASGVASFNPGDLVAVDIDYTGQTGYVGTGVSAAYVKSVVGLSADYIRRVTFNVSRVAQKTATSLILAQPLIGGAPSAAAKVQKVTAFTDREGGSFTPEWSGLFLLESESGARVCLYYPRLQPCSPSRESFAAIADPLRSAPGVTDIPGPLSAIGLHASFTALPYADPNDGEPILCWRSYFPASNTAVY
jgi:hypothetical protein